MQNSFFQQKNCFKSDLEIFIRNFMYVFSFSIYILHKTCIEKNAEKQSDKASPNELIKWKSSTALTINPKL